MQLQRQQARPLLMAPTLCRVTSTGRQYSAIRGSGGSLDFDWIFPYKKQPNHFYTVLLITTEVLNLKLYYSILPSRRGTGATGNSYVRNIGRIWLETVGYFR
jgi:hypothetical protein